MPTTQSSLGSMTPLVHPISELDKLVRNLEDFIFSTSRIIPQITLLGIRQQSPNGLSYQIGISGYLCRLSTRCPAPAPLLAMTSIQGQEEPAVASSRPAAPP